MPNQVLSPLTQVWVVDTAVVYTTTDTTRHRYSFNEQAKMIIDLVERWTTGQWVNYWRYTFSYDANGRMLTRLYEQVINSQWVNGDRLTCTYDTNGNMATRQYENWQGGVWVPSDVIFSVMDIAGNHYSWYGNKVMLRYRLITSDVAQGGNEIPTQYTLMQNYPNPFNPTTTIEYTLPQRASVEIKVLDVLGREVGTLVNEEKPSGVYSLQWNADGAASGVYFYRLKVGGFVETKKMLLLR